MENKINKEKHLNYFKDKLIAHYLNSQNTEEITVEKIHNRAENATDTYFSILNSGKEPAYALEKALTLLFSEFRKT